VGQIFISTNSGINWYQSGAPSNSWLSLSVSADGAKIIASGIWQTNFFISTDGGTTWESDNTGVPTVWYPVSISADGSTLLAVRQSGGVNAAVYMSTNLGVTWTSNDLGVASSHGFAGLSSAAMSVDGSCSLVSAHRLFTSNNSGATWMQASNSNGAFAYGAACVATSADGGKAFLGISYDSSYNSGGNLYTSFRPLNPYLNVSNSNSDIALSWIVPSTNFVLQQNSNLSATVWVTVTNIPVFDLITLQEKIILQQTGDAAFYRLQTP
jgi:hypothetical protein